MCEVSTVPLRVGATCPCYFGYVLFSEKRGTPFRLTLRLAQTQAMSRLSPAARKEAVAALARYSVGRVTVWTPEEGPSGATVFTLRSQRGRPAMQATAAANGLARDLSTGVPPLPAPLARSVFLPFSTARIVGGTPLTDPLARAFVIKLNTLVGTCSGALVSPRHALTVAHCAVRPGDTAFILSPGGGAGGGGSGGRGGEREQKAGKSGGVTRVVVAVATHPNWEERTLAHDVAVLTLAADVPGFYAARQFTVDGHSSGKDGGGVDRTPPVVVNHNPAIPVTGSGVRVAGFGLISHVWKTPGRMERSVDVRVVAPAPCFASFARAEGSEEIEPLSSLLHPAMHVCAGVAAGGCDACHGDSGGPLYQSMRMRRLGKRGPGQVPRGGGRSAGGDAKSSPPSTTKAATTTTTAKAAAATTTPNGGTTADKDDDDDGGTVLTYVLVGLTSFSPGCADVDTPTAYLRLSAYAGWIDSVVGQGTGPVRPDGTRVGGPEDTATYSFRPSLDGKGQGRSGRNGRQTDGGGGHGGRARESASPSGVEERDRGGERGSDDDSDAPSTSVGDGSRTILSAGAAVGVGVGVLAAVVLTAVVVLSGVRLARSRLLRGAGGAREEGEGGGG
ncbi:hypothetical protein MMPV_009049 [Pyropia vietnamensis]